MGNPGNPADSATSYGSVAYEYNIGTYEVTNAQYAEFLNAVADTDTNALYNASMGSGLGGITRTGLPGSFTYSAIAGRGDKPVNFVSFYDSLRFANWLHNGQLTGSQDGTTTEGGAYTITAAGIASNSITRNANATIFLTSESEWYKAAYYNALSTSYFNYPAGSDTQTTCATPTATANRANCENAVGDLTNKGSYTGSASPYGTFDQGGNVLEWNEGINSGTLRSVRGGGWAFNFFGAASLARGSRFGYDPATTEHSDKGFRVASIPEPGTGSLMMLGLLALARRASRSSSD